VDVEGAAIHVTDKISGEDVIFYDKEDPPMVVGSTYASMNEFRSAVMLWRGRLIWGCKSLIQIVLEAIAKLRVVDRLFRQG
jgi:hypothetical protein